MERWSVSATLAPRAPNFELVRASSSKRSFNPKGSRGGSSSSVGVVGRRNSASRVVSSTGFGGVRASASGRRFGPRIWAMGTSTQIKDGVELKVFESVQDLGDDLADYVAALSKCAVEARAAFSIVLSGGSLISTMGKLTEEPYLGSIDWARWHVFWADERVVPLDHPDSNYKLALDGLLSKVPIPPGNVYAINDKLSPQKAAEDYELGLKQLVKKNVLRLDEAGEYPRFDLILLGMGPDGHLASLFPHHPLVSKTDTWVASIEDSPKPPPERITLTLPAINAAENVAFVATGSGKADKLKLVFGGDLPFGEVPAKLVSPVSGKLVWFADKPAVAKL
ncbi:6-phosphogluconolactonase [Marchantia polymorpha subsp. ruderalis]|uniref:6-phosphogluconolactonase n=2 Tax=Marchantia polymorpha TaxID=3197 RepID=A0A176W5F0_MARPO|nr:hypothetical protein AXG93_1881s1220 [Marchantia polymorpha subsp. ruderalis]PTQ47063.1 hypothetical protein MARPO_0009s0152 [Marchantia polymorpha]BBN17457.1 hypothetical protein Mp_7g14670 [Marchantia polymorpha subsp. ruderalis]|eukprot:PTQ47063.1 hypothetical protein MARPO_0009s0152 [Marchantia polymorpha]